MRLFIFDRGDCGSSWGWFGVGRVGSVFDVGGTSWALYGGLKGLVIFDGVGGLHKVDHV